MLYVIMMSVFMLNVVAPRVVGKYISSDIVFSIKIRFTALDKF
jgi:hypothetical protein